MDDLLVEKKAGHRRGSAELLLSKNSFPLEGAR
jgi:hypothetical protein